MTDGINYDGNPGEHIAIIGMTGRFPGAKNTDAFWQNLRDGVESITFFTADELATSTLDKNLLSNARYVGADGIIEDMDMFDAEFFSIPPREAELLDPQHRLFLECAWELMEQAGYDSESYTGRVAVYGSANLSTYLIRNIMSNPDLRETASSFQTMLANDKDFVATRVSYKMNLKGPSLSVATLCSSGSLAVHMGCQALLNYQSDMALAGAVSLQVSRNETYFYQEGGIGDPDGHCRAFDAKASGTVSGSGVSLVALKRLEDAINDGDNILAVLRSTAVNNDGAIKYSFTAPSVDGQAEVIAEAIALAEVDPETITYVETHGTGTRLGDPIEITALTQAFRGNGAEANQFCAIGSVKTNIGHLVNAGGVASLIKTVLAMQHGQIPPSLHFDEPNPEIDFPNSPFYVATKLIDWQPNGFPRRAGVSSFGIGGTNVHMVVEEAPQLAPSGKSRAQQLIVLSAKTSTALEKQTENLTEYLKAHPNADLADIAFTLQVGRHGFAHRRAFLCNSIGDALEALSGKDASRVQTYFQQSKNRPVAFIFPATGELVNAGYELYQTEPTFREQIDACAAIVQPMLKLDLRKTLYPKPAEVEQAGQTLKQPTVAQAALFTWEYALAKLWQEWGVQPQTMLGLGVGELVAGCLAGTLSPEAALSLIATGQSITEDDLQAPEMTWISATNQKRITEKEATDPAYWNGVLTRTGSFAERVKGLLKESEQVLLEIGPGQALTALLAEHSEKTEQQVILASLGASSNLLPTLGELWLAGVQVDWYGFSSHEKRHRLSLPTYPFERKRYWIEPGNAGTTIAAPDINKKKPNLADWFYIPSWKRSLLHHHTATSASWLLFMDEHGLGEQLAQRLAQTGDKVFTVRAGAAFARVNDETYQINPQQKADYDALLTDLLSHDQRPQNIVHLWSVTAGQPTQDDGFSGLISLAQSLEQHPLAEKCALTVVSNGLHEVSETDTLSTEKAAILGAALVMSQENTSITCKNVDVVWPQTGEKLAGQLHAEVTADAKDAVVAYRGAHRWVQAYEPVQIQKPGEGNIRLRKGGSYLILGGLDGIGLALAKHLSEKFAAKLTLVRQPGSAPLSPQVLATLGADVLLLEANAIDKDQLKVAVSQALTRFGQLNGVIHTSDGFGQAAFSSIIEIQKDAYQAGSSVIQNGLQTLAQVLEDQELDFCLITSSLASILGGLGLAAYTATYRYVDAFVRQHNRASSHPWISVNWDSWKFADAPKSSFGDRLDALSILPEEGADALERILACSDAAQIIVSTADLHGRLQQWVTHDSGADAALSGKPVVLHARPELVTPYVAPKNEIEQQIAEIWQALLGIEKIGIHDNFFELGGHSLLAVQIISRMRAAFGIDLPLTNLFEQPTIAFLAEYVAAVRWALQDQGNVQEEGRQEIEL